MFLTPLLDTPDAPWTLRNSRNGLVVGRQLEPAFDSETRRRGLLGRDRLDAGAALVIAPSNSIHTFFMKFAIDAVFVRRDGRVVKVLQNLRPWRLGFCWSAFAVIELPAGTAEKADVHTGDSFEIVR